MISTIPIWRSDTIQDLICLRQSLKRVFDPDCQFFFAHVLILC